jgi:actin-related protein 5
LIKGFAERIEAEARIILPYDFDFHVITAENPLLDCWRGASLFARTDEFSRACVTREEYLEYGGHYLKDHRFANPFRRN